MGLESGVLHSTSRRTVQAEDFSDVPAAGIFSHRHGDSDAGPHNVGAASSSADSNPRLRNRTTRRDNTSFTAYGGS
jgi:hypothetical protein